jgi:hypothetical protein
MEKDRECLLSKVKLMLRHNAASSMSLALDRVRQRSRCGTGYERFHGSHASDRCGAERGTTIR